MITQQDAIDICNQLNQTMPEKIDVVQRYVFDRVGLVLPIPYPMTPQETTNIDKTFTDAQAYYL